MTTETLHDCDRLVDTGFSDDQARAVVGLLATSSETNPQVSRTLELILRRLDEHSEMLNKLNARLDIIEQRIHSESRIQRMLNTTLIAIGALLGSLLAVFAR